MQKPTEKTNRNNRIQLSLAASMFFAPFVKSLIKKTHFELSSEDEQFVQGYIRLGFLTLLALFVTIASAIALYFFTNVVFLWIYKISVVLLVALLLLGTFGTLANIQILQESGESFHYQKIKNDKSDIFISFLPIYNIYLWYKLHDFDHPYRRAKESILWWTLFVIFALLTKNAIVTGFILTIIIIRVASLMSWIDVFDSSIKKHINKIFYKNPEELWWYVRWIVVFRVQKFTVKNNQKISFKQSIQKEKETMQHLFSIQNKALLAQYIIGVILLWGWFFLGSYSANQRENRVVIMTIILLWGRYSLMLIKWRHMPQIPIAKELVDAGVYLYQKFISKTKKN